MIKVHTMEAVWKEDLKSLEFSVKQCTLLSRIVPRRPSSATVSLFSLIHYPRFHSFAGRWAESSPATREHEGEGRMDLGPPRTDQEEFVSGTERPAPNEPRKKNAAWSAGSAPNSKTPPAGRPARAPSASPTKPPRVNPKRQRSPPGPRRWPSRPRRPRPSAPPGPSRRPPENYASSSSRPRRSGWPSCWRRWRRWGRRGRWEGSGTSHDK
jgi:hypothetical protein